MTLMTTKTPNTTDATFTITVDLQILQHALGVNQYGEGTQFRNHYVTSKEGPDGLVCKNLVERGLMTQREVSRELTGGAEYFAATPSGVSYVAAQSPKPPKLTRKQMNYRRWLAANTGASFHEWLGAPSLH
jgi:hypothetical protein